MTIKGKIIQWIKTKLNILKFIVSLVIKIVEMQNKNLNRKDFMDFFRDDEKLNLLTVDDRIEIFSQILLGSSDFTKKLLDDIFIDYSVSNLQIIEISNG